jgi:hypothetical protein
MLLTGVAILPSLSTLIHAAAFPQTANDTIASPVANSFSPTYPKTTMVLRQWETSKRGPGLGDVSGNQTTMYATTNA